MRRFKGRRKHGCFQGHRGGLFRSHRNLFQSRGRLYRSRRGVFLGVCRGLADYFNLNVVWLRIILVIIMVFSCFWPVLCLYLIASLLVKPEPIKPIHTEDEQDFYDSYVYSRQRAVREIKRRYENLERRIRRMEDTVTGPEFNWDEKINA